MTYRFQDRLRHASDRFAEVNTEDVIYIAGNKQKPIKVSPILMSSDELNPGDPSMVRLERQDFAIDREQLGSFYPPAPGHKIKRLTGEVFVLNSMGVSEPPYVHVTSSRDRVIVHTIRTKSDT